MATNRWTGTAPAIAQINTITPANVAVGNIFNLTIGQKVISYTAAAATAQDVITGLVTKVNASLYPEFLEVTAADPGNAANFTLTAKVAGRPFTQTSNATGGTATLTTATTTANSGPSDISLSQNWTSGGAAQLPQAGDDVYIETPVPLLYNLGALAGITFNSLTVSPSFGNNAIGLPLFNPAGYFEYRPINLQMAATTSTVNCTSGLIRLDSQAVAVTVLVQNSGNPTEANTEPVRWKGTNAANVVQVTKGTLGIARVAGETATIATLDVGYQTNQLGDANVICGSGTTLTTITKSGGTLTINSGATTINQFAGILTVAGTGSVTTLTIDGGTCFFTSTGNITTPTVGNQGTLDFSQDLRTRTAGTIQLYRGAVLNDPQKTVTSMVFKLNRCTLKDVTVNTGFNAQYSQS